MFGVYKNIYPNKEHQVEWKCSKIFRPWDCSDNSEDVSVRAETSTVENNTQLDQNHCKNNCDAIRNSVNNYSLPISVPTVQSSLLTDCALPYPADPFAPNIAQYLGLSSGDAVFLDSISNSYAVEEYTRILNQEQQTKIMQSRKQRPKKYKCPHCDVGFSNNGQLKGHIRIHTGERPFKCEEKNCGKTFTRNEELTRHKRIHSGLRPFACSQCGKRFGRKDHLKKHSKTHYPTRGMYAVPVMFPYEAWSSPSNFSLMNLMY